ncbi:hypothetical protein C900_04139 [Fulvivirga imtechensis AK7]|uniref:DNA ligase D polymerase domain-containing protein n=1 Tax=Fulvivirga imtechensis AK7 TaxID=1237149 RepID=L8K1G9_9BACT|nr:non-homologous end-joining DNA ligase [Fulvivirga imtechensis]ELR73287.1 hypothetical protein C900_04139 [Fulvivirga imtechensis AK7]
MKVGRRNTDITSEEKLIFPALGISKRELVDYYYTIAPCMLPYIEDRPLMLQRFPNGIEKGGFYQKEASEYFPDWIETTIVPKENGEVEHVVCNNPATLVYLANQATVSIHSWLSKTKNINNPDKFIIDLDPPSDDFEEVRRAAFLVKDFIDELSVKSFIMTTGSSGMHVIVPLDARFSFDLVRETGHAIAEELTERHPDVFTTARFKSDRDGKIYLDIQRNAYAQTGIAPYSLRSLAEASVATPLEWTELGDQAIDARTFTIKNIHERIAEKGDPWKGMRRHAISLKSLERKLQKVQTLHHSH